MKVHHSTSNKSFPAYVRGIHFFTQVGFGCVKRLPPKVSHLTWIRTEYLSTRRRNV